MGRFLVLCMLWLCGIWGSTAAWAFSVQDVSAVLQKSAGTQGRFIQQRYLRALEQPMTSSGSFVLLPGKGLLWQMQQPFATVLRVRYDGVMRWTGSSWVRQGAATGAAVQSRQVGLFLDVLSGNTQGLQSQFDLTLSGTAERWQIRLVPKTALMQQIFTHIVIAGDQRIQQIELHEKQGDKVVLALKDMGDVARLDSFAASALGVAQP